MAFTLALRRGAGIIAGMIRRAAYALAAVPCLPGQALAHASEQSFVLLLPTDLYIGGGVAAVAATILLLIFLPPRLAVRCFASVALWHRTPDVLRDVANCLSALVLLALVIGGLYGARDPLVNPLPLAVWTLFWIVLVTVQALVFDIWAWVNPFAGPLKAIRALAGDPVPLRIPGRVAEGIAIATFLAFAYLMLADPAPADPARLARIVAIYWICTMLAGLVFGPRWLRRGEGLGAMMRCYARLAPVRARAGRLRLGLPGWAVANGREPSTGMAVLIVLLLGTGSFDGLHETYRWLGLLGINPFEYPGRSAMIGRNMAGLLLANLALLGIVAATVRLGQVWAGGSAGWGQGLRAYAPTLLPIAIAYHIAHYLPTFLVDGQYLLVALSDPLHTGADLLGLGAHYVSTGFFNAQGPVRAIFLSQAGAVVLGHMLAILLAHVIALRRFPDARRAAISQAPMAVFMVVYTFFGLWLLASPRL